MELLQIQCTLKNQEEAELIARSVVEKRYVACVNIVPNISSIYLWEGKVECSKEVKMYLKTTSNHYAAVEREIREKSSYAVTEILKFRIDGGHPDYLEWMESSVASK